jgi:CubicO group peptidase (beta-lactamase class C family)
MGGITNARGLAGMYAPLACGGSLKGLDLVDRDTLARMSAVSSATSQDMTLVIPLRYSLGYWKSTDNRRQPPNLQDGMILSEDAFGHPGMGGSIGLADPRERMSFGYTMNNMGPGTALNPRGQSLVDAVYLSLGFRSNASGSWLR